jgi:hypothetical protein
VWESQQGNSLHSNTGIVLLLGHDTYPLNRTQLTIHQRYNKLCTEKRLPV